MPTAINNNPANISIKAIQKLAQFKSKQDPCMIAIAKTIKQSKARITGLRTQGVLPDIIATIVSILTLNFNKVGI